VTGCCEHGNEPSGSIKGAEFIRQLSECWLFMERVITSSNSKYLGQVAVLEISSP
jgi:hypothetical protein